MKTQSWFRANSISESGDIDRRRKKPPETYKGLKSPGLIGLKYKLVFSILMIEQEVNKTKHIRDWKFHT